MQLSLKEDEDSEQAAKFDNYRDLVKKKITIKMQNAGKHLTLKSFKTFISSNTMRESSRSISISKDSRMSKISKQLFGTQT